MPATSRTGAQGTSMRRLVRARLTLSFFLGVSAPVLLWAQGVTEYPLPAAGLPEGITTGPDGALWFTESNGNRIGRLAVPQS